MWHVDLLSSPANRFRGPKAHVPTTFAMQHEHSRRLECPRRALAQPTDNMSIAADHASRVFAYLSQRRH